MRENDKDKFMRILKKSTDKQLAIFLFLLFLTMGLVVWNVYFWVLCGAASSTLYLWLKKMRDKN